MTMPVPMRIKHPEVGICGLSCRLCPTYQSTAASRCGGCKSPGRMQVGCPFITCAVKKRGVEFCWECPDHAACPKWAAHRKHGRSRDSFVCYQRLEDTIAGIERRGLAAFVADQKKRERLLEAMLRDFNEGRSKSYYCIAATVMTVPELSRALTAARQAARGMDVKTRARILHAILDKIASSRKYNLKLRT
jgi:hypothetical protein